MFFLSRLLLLLMPSPLLLSFFLMPNFPLSAQSLPTSSYPSPVFPSRISSPFPLPLRFVNISKSNNRKLSAELRNPVFRQLLKQRLREAERRQKSQTKQSERCTRRAGDVTSADGCKKRRRLTFVSHHQRNCFFSPINCHLQPALGAFGRRPMTDYTYYTQKQEGQSRR